MTLDELKRLEASTVNTAPIARLTVDDSGLVVRAGLYAPGLPVGDHDVWCVPVSERDRLALLDAECVNLKAERDDWREQARRLRAALEAAPKMAAVFRDSDQYDYWFTTTRAEALK